eukprot:PhF_6_TR12649/c0_g2_i2/m.20090
MEKDGLFMEQLIHYEVPTDEQDTALWLACYSEKPPTLSTITPNSPQALGWIMKKGEPKQGIMGALDGLGVGTSYEKRFFVAQGNFIYYFKKDTPTEVARGCIYMKHIKVERLMLTEGQHAVLKLYPCIPRKPGRPVDSSEANNYFLSFDSEADLEKWLSVLRAANAWQHDADAKQCFECKKEFTLM